MKKLLLCTAIAVFGLSNFNVNAQDVSFGVTAGYLNVSAKASTSGISVSDSDSGFYIGGVADITLSEKIHIQPELVYAKVGEGDGLILPIMLKYYVSEKFNIQAGPHFDIATEEVPDDFTGFGISLGAGVGFDINEDFFIEGRYSFQLNDYYTGDLDLDITTSSLMIGVGYKF